MPPEKDGSSAWWLTMASLLELDPLTTSARLSQQVRDVDYSYHMRSNTVLSQLRVTVVAGHSGALVG